MKRALYVSAILVMLTSAPLAAQRTGSPIRSVKQREVISTLFATPASVWQGFIDLVLDGQGRLTIARSTKPGKGNMKVNGVITEPIGLQPPPPPPPSQP